MARFSEAEDRILRVKICMNCYARNPVRADVCRRCKRKELRMKASETRGV